MNQDKQKCAFCKFCNYDTEVSHYICHNEDSECYGKQIDDTHNHKCDKIEIPDYDISLKEALRIITETSKSAYYGYKSPDNERKETFIFLSFDSNTDLENWKIAHLRLLKEYIDMAIADGDIKEDN